MNSNKNLDELNKIWTEESLRDFIKRMYIYYDPWDLIVLGSPYDEYDSYINDLHKYLLDENKTKTKGVISELIFSIFNNNDQNQSKLKSKSEKMAEDILELIQSH